MIGPIARICTELPPGRFQPTDASPKGLADYRTEPAYVLLGDPGLGKTTAFQTESEALGDDARFISARDLLLHDELPDRLLGKTLFIDGLDEVRAGRRDARIPLDGIRRLLLGANRPRFRISCREADWLGDNDLQRLGYAVPNSAVKLLRLEPLEMEAILEILRCNFGVGRPEDFVANARQAGLEGLLGNPQALELLVRAVHQGKRWSSSRPEVFELACKQMADERNPEHQIASPGRPSRQSLIDCAGRLCALLLISDKAGCSLDANERREGFSPPDLCGVEDPECLGAAVSSKLFRAAADRCFRPVHRQIAEFLGAKHLASLIEGGLPVRRVLALMTGGDGVPATALQGLSAWLATLNESVRTELIRRSPVDLALYGDLKAFAEVEKSRVLEALLAKPWALLRAFSRPAGFLPLVAAPTEARIRKVLLSANRDQDQEIRVTFLLWLLWNGGWTGGLAEPVRGLVRDDSWTPAVREAALDALVRWLPGTPGGRKELQVLLAGFKAERISIANRNLCGILLSALYPHTAGPSEVWAYLTHIGREGPGDRYLKFWRRDLVAQSLATNGTLAELLDSLAALQPRLQPTIDALGLRVLPIEILEHGLERYGDSVDLKRLSAWLGTCTGSVRWYAGSPPESLVKVRAWLAGRPTVQKQIILAGLQGCSDGVSLRHADFNNRERLLGARLPADFGLWCLDEAVRLADSAPRVAKHLLTRATRAIEIPGIGKGLSRDVLRRQTVRDPMLHKVLSDLQSTAPEQALEEPWHQRQAARLAEREQFRKNVRACEEHLLDNRASPGLLHQLARVYFGEVPEISGSSKGEDAIARALVDRVASDAAMHGLRHSVYRDDLPSAREVVRLAKDRREPYICLPLLAGLRERQESDPGFLLDLDNRRLETFVACLHCWEPYFLQLADPNPAWYRVLLEDRLGVVSDVAVQCAASALRRSGVIAQRFWEIVHREKGGPYARNAVIRLLKALPTRCNARQVDVLDELLWMGLESGWKSDLSDFAGQRLTRKHMDAGQRVRWLGLALLCDPGTHRTALAEAIEGKRATGQAPGTILRPRQQQTFAIQRSTNRSQRAHGTGSLVDRSFDREVLPPVRAKRLHDRFRRTTRRVRASRQHYPYAWFQSLQKRQRVSGLVAARFASVELARCSVSGTQGSEHASKSRRVSPSDASTGVRDLARREAGQRQRPGGADWRQAQGNWPPHPDQQLQRVAPVLERRPRGRSPGP